MTKTINIGDFSEELREFTNRTLEEQKKGVTSGILRSLPDLVESSPIDTGLYASSWDFTETEKSVIVGNTAPHAPIIEKGARPFTPPIQPLLQWAKRVLKDSSQPPNYSQSVWALAKATQQKIQNVGMKPRNVLENALPLILENIRKEFNSIG